MDLSRFARRRVTAC